MKEFSQGRTGALGLRAPQPFHHLAEGTGEGHGDGLRRPARRTRTAPTSSPICARLSDNPVPLPERQRPPPTQWRGRASRPMPAAPPRQPSPPKERRAAPARRQPHRDGAPLPTAEPAAGRASHGCCAGPMTKPHIVRSRKSRVRPAFLLSRAPNMPDCLWIDTRARQSR